ncbi:MAG: PPC domain-containing DNA-binding protein [Desulfovibrionaceae bacterium]
MQYSEGIMGRIFVIRLENGDKLPDAIEAFAKEKDINGAACWYVGGMHDGTLVVGPETTDERPPRTMLHVLDGVHEAAAVGTIFPDESGQPRLHMHAAMGREGETRTGCIRPGVHTWVVGEVVVIEVCGTDMRRLHDEETGLGLLQNTRPTIA